MSIDIFQIQTVHQAFPFIESLPPELKADFWNKSQPIILPAGDFIFMEGDNCSHLALILSGSARVYKMGQSGREITLYRIEPGESCIMTASCIISHQNFPAFAIAETEIKAIGIPAKALGKWVAQNSAWQNYIFSLLCQRLTTVMEVVEAVAFQRMDCRIATYLVNNAESGTQELQTTHELIAQELGSSREVISRILKNFEKRGLLQLSRGIITNLNLSELQKI